MKEDLPLEMSVALMEIADGLRDGLMKIEMTQARLEARLDMLAETSTRSSSSSQAPGSYRR